ncbi:MAG TPA: DUF2225 domain-containing protein [Thermoclostridium sp.]|nr:DUF2225 domain-containing protein [Thermoclostridium sp.]
MTKLKPTYNSEIICPVCESNIKVTKVRSKSVKLLKQDDDFCPHYETVNPIYYEAWVCNHCGYAAHNTVFEEITRQERKNVLEKISKKWTSRDFAGKRNWVQALEAFKLVLYNLQVREASYSQFAKICLRIAWLYRYDGDVEEERVYLELAFDYYKQVYNKENLNGNLLDEYTCIYIIGILANKLGSTSEATVWLSKLISAGSNPKERGKIPAGLLDNAREQIYTIRTEMKNKKDA